MYIYNCTNIYYKKWMHYVADMIQVSIHLQKQQQRKPSSCGTTTKTT